MLPLPRRRNRPRRPSREDVREHREIGRPGTVLALVCSGLLLAQAAGDDKQKKKDKPRERPKTEEKTGETKLFQLDAIIIDVIEKARDAAVPNMSVVKPELFPLGIGTMVDTALERQPGVEVQRIQEVGTAMDDDSIKIRGLGARRIKVLRDGRPLNTSGAAGATSSTSP